jgi:hypothetical protein
MRIKYRVDLTEAERAQLLGLISKGKHGARTLARPHRMRNSKRSAVRSSSPTGVRRCGIRAEAALASGLRRWCNSRRCDRWRLSTV